MSRMVHRITKQLQIQSCTLSLLNLQHIFKYAIWCKQKIFEILHAQDKKNFEYFLSEKAVNLSQWSRSCIQTEPNHLLSTEVSWDYVS